MTDYGRDTNIGKPQLVDGKHILLAIEAIGGDANIIDDVVPNEETDTES